MDLDARISLVPPHVANQGMFDDTQVSDQPKEQLGVFSAAKVLADAAEQRRDYCWCKGKAVMQESKPPKKIKKRVQVQMSIDEELSQKVHEEEQARFNAEQEVKFKAEQEQERLDHDLSLKLYEKFNLCSMDSKLEVQRRKRAGQDVVEEPAKRQRTGEASGSVQEQTSEEQKAEELSQEQLHQMMMKFDRDDLDKLWNLVKERFRTTEPTKDKARELWVELKRLFKPDDNDTLWKLQRYMHDPLNWWLYDTCGVHHVSTERGHDIYMLVEKDYPLTKALMTLMLCNKLRVDQYSDMAEELLKKIFILVERPRQ
ncbi:hypothetical protein Tco_1009672 [Tanacetum coccineum]